MQFNTHATNNDLVSDCKFLITGSYTGTIDYHINDMTRSANNKLSEVASLIMKHDNRWEFDDDNFETLPIGTTDLVAGQQDYEIAVADFLNIQEVQIKDDKGNWIVIQPVDRNKGKAQRLSDLEEEDGLPLYYDKLGSSIFLYPKPAAGNVTATQGLRVRFQRNPSYFLTTDTTKEPGFPRIFHRIVSIGMALDYCLSNELSNKLERLKMEEVAIRESIEDYYTERNKDEQLKMSLNNDDNDIVY